MFVIEITDKDAMKRLVAYCADITDQGTRGHYSVRVGIDPLDNGLKFSVNNSTWSPPIRGAISGGND